MQIRILPFGVSAPSLKDRETAVCLQSYWTKFSEIFFQFFIEKEKRKIDVSIVRPEESDPTFKIPKKISPRFSDLTAKSFFATLGARRTLEACPYTPTFGETPSDIYLCFSFF